MCEVDSTPAVEKGGQPTYLYVDVDVDTIAKDKTRIGRGKRKKSPESSEEPVKTPRTVAATVGVNTKKCVVLSRGRRKHQKEMLL